MNRAVGQEGQSVSLHAQVVELVVALKKAASLHKQVVKACILLVLQLLQRPHSLTLQHIGSRGRHAP